MKPDIQIAQEHHPIPIKQIATEKLGLYEDDIIPFGRVSQGMNVVDQLLSETADGVDGREFIDIRRVIRTK